MTMKTFGSVLFVSGVALMAACVGEDSTATGTTPGGSSGDGGASSSSGAPPGEKNASLAIAPSSLSFPITAPTTTSSARKVTVTNKGTGIAGDPSISLPTTKPNSWLFGVGNDWDNREVLTPNAGTTIVGQGASTITDTFFTLRSTNPAPNAGTSSTIGVSGIGTDRYNFAVIEIRQP